MTPESHIAQLAFDARYITSTEVRERLNMTRPVLLHHRQKGRLPNEIKLQSGQLLLWEREFIEPFLVKLEEDRSQRNTQ